MSNVCIFDRVTLQNGNEGEVKFMGMIEGKEGIYYGIKLDKSIGKNNGSFGSIQYFECRDKYGIFVTAGKIKSHKTTQLNESLPRVCIGDTVHVNHKRENGILRFVGTVHFDDECFYGVQLLEPLGDNDGCIDGRQYFHCPYYYGTFGKSTGIKLVKKMDPTLLSVSADPIQPSLEIKQATSEESNHLQIPNNIKPFNENNPSFDPELHDLDPQNDDFYKPIASTYKSDENNDCKQQSLIHYTGHLDANDNEIDVEAINIKVTVPIPVSNPGVACQPMNMNMAPLHWNPAPATNYHTNNQFIFNNNVSNNMQSSQKIPNMQNVNVSNIQSNKVSTMQPIQSNMQYTAFPYQPSQNKYNDMNKFADKNVKVESQKWRKARDPSSGRLYWYHIDTKKTTWHKPKENVNTVKNNPYCFPNLTTAMNTYSPKANKEFMEKHTVNDNICRDNRTSEHNRCWVLGLGQEFQMQTWAKHKYDIESHKKGLFGKKQQTVYEILRFTEFNKMKNPLNKKANSEPHIKDQCMQMWKNINSYMGLRKSSKSSNGHVNKLIQYAIYGNDTVRDEIYCQIIKQLTKNPKLTSVIKGYKLLLICCSFFAPSKQFIGYLSCFLWHNTQQSNEVGMFAIKALHALDNTMLNGDGKALPLQKQIVKLENLQGLNEKSN